MSNEEIEREKDDALLKHEKARRRFSAICAVLLNASHEMNKITYALGRATDSPDYSEVAQRIEQAGEEPFAFMDRAKIKSLVADYEGARVELLFQRKRLQGLGL